MCACPLSCSIVCCSVQLWQLFLDVDFRALDLEHLPHALWEDARAASAMWHPQFEITTRESRLGVRAPQGYHGDTSRMFYVGRVSDVS